MRIRVSRSRASIFVHLLVLVILLAAVWILQPLALFGMTPSESRLLPSDLSLGDEFGEPVSIDGDTLVTAARLDDDAFQNSGSAYVFRLINNTWIEEAKLNASDPSPSANLGRSISISGDTVIVGADGADGLELKAGKSYVFRRSGTVWTEEAILIANDGQEGDSLGRSIDIDGDVAVIGADNEDEKGSDAGAVYVFRRNGTTWVQEAKLTASDGSADDNFGISVSIDGDTIVVGADFASGPVVNSPGAAYVFRRNGTSWSQEAKLTASDPSALGLFGVSVGISTETIVVGAIRHDDAFTDAGAAYVFRRNGTTWNEETKLLGSEPDRKNHFGWVSIDGNIIVVGAPIANNKPPTEPGMVYVFKHDGLAWNEELKLVASDSIAPEGNRFGATTAIFSDTVVVGAHRDDNFTGAAYVYGLQSTSNNPPTAKALADQGTGNMIDERFDHTSTLLQDGRVLVATGRQIPPTTSIVTAELYDPSTRTFSPTGSLATARSAPAATLLNDGKVLIAGGHTGAYGAFLSSAELYDPASGAFSPTGNMTDVRVIFTATRLASGAVLMVGGLSSSTVTVASAELYDPATGLFALTGSMAEAQGRHHHTATLLPNGKVLIVGGGE